MEVVVGWQRRRQRALTVRRLYLPSQLTDPVTPFPEGIFRKGKLQSNGACIEINCSFAKNLRKRMKLVRIKLLRFFDNLPLRNKWLEIKLFEYVPLRLWLRPIFTVIKVAFLKVRICSTKTRIKTLQFVQSRNSISDEPVNSTTPRIKTPNSELCGNPHKWTNQFHYTKD